MKQNEYSMYIVGEIFRTRKFIGGQDLCKLLVNRFKISEVNARKVVERTVERGDVASSSPYTFGNRQFVYVLNKKFFTFDGLIKISKEYSKPLFRLLVTLSKNNGVISCFEAKKITASAHKNKDSKKTNFNKIVAVLVEYGIATENIFNGIKYLVLKGSDEFVASEHNRYLGECRLVSDVLRFLLNANILSDKDVYYRSSLNLEGCICHDVHVDAFGKSMAFGNNGQDFSEVVLMLDTVLLREYLVADLEGFYERVSIVRNSIKHGRRLVVPVVAYYDAEITVATKLKSLGYLRLSLSTIFGSKINKIIKGFSELSLSYLNSENATDTIKNVLESIASSGQEDNLQNLRGKLFECVMYLLLRGIFSNGNIYFNKTIQGPPGGKPKSHEYDFIIHHNDEIIIVEVKGYKKDAAIKLGDKDTRDTVKWFTETKLDFAKQYYPPLGFAGNGSSLKYCYITTGKFDDDARNYLIKMGARKMTSPLIDRFYDGQSLMTLVNEKQRKDLGAVLKGFFMK